MTSKGTIILSRSGNISRGPRIPGVFPASRFGEQVLSTGIPSLDSYLGGGVPVGSICILRDTYPCRYADLILKCFIAEGALYNHNLYVASDTVSPAVFANELPALRKNANTEDQRDNNPSNSSGSSDGSNLKIAWRYGVATSPAVVKGQKEAKFEFKQKTSVTALGKANLVTSAACQSLDLSPPKTVDLLQEIAAVASPFIIGSRSGLEKRQVTNILRIAISHCEDQVLNPKFMLGLRSIVRRTNSCAVITLSNFNFSSFCADRALDFADHIIRLEVILDENRKAELGDVDGVCEMTRLASVNSIKPNELPRDLGFSFRNKRLTFQELHIPPEGENTTQRETSSRQVHVSSSPSCGATVKGKSIDF